MYKIIKFICIWVLPIGLVKLLPLDRLFGIDTVDGNQLYYRIEDSKKHRGAGILIRKS
tara:strand:+ start:355 stop:528 length:174 start_codon:yes stop_codon:yes gene_type:complete